MPNAERMHAHEVMIDAASGRIPQIAGCHHQSVKDATMLANHAWDVGFASTPDTDGGEVQPFASAYFWRRPDEDRFLRHAARIAVEHAPPGEWSQRALQERIAQAGAAAAVQRAVAAPGATAETKKHGQELLGKLRAL